MAEYFALVSDNYMQLDTRSNQMEIYETKNSAEVAAHGLDVSVEEVEVVRKKTYESLQRERDALSEALGNLIRGCQESFDWQYDPNFEKIFNKTSKIFEKAERSRP